MYYFIVLNLKAILFLFMTQAIHKTWIIFTVTSLISLNVLLIMYKLFTKRKHLITFIGYTLFSILMFADVLYCLYYNRLLSLSIQSQVAQLPGVTNIISSLLNIWVILFIIDIPLLLFYFRSKKSFEMKPLNVDYFALKITFNITIILFLFSNHLQTIKAYEFFTYHTVDIVESIGVDEELIEETTMIDIGDLINRSTLVDGPLTSIANGRNVVLIQIEAMQALTLNRMIQGHEITPNLNALLKDSGTLYFNDIYQSVARGNTSDAEFAMLNSLIPSVQQIYYEEAADKDYYSLAHLLSDHDYSTMYFHANEGTFYNREEMAKAEGFEYFFDASKFDLFDESEVISYGLNDFSFLKQTVEYIKEIDQESTDPWMAFVITLSSHSPYDLREDQKTLILKNDESNIALSYFEAIHYTDAALGEFIDDLKTNGLYEDTIFVIYGDHFGLNSGSEDHKVAIESVIDEEYTLEKMMNIPLIIHIPETEVHQTIEKTGSQIDIYPTLINLLGIRNTQGVMLGTDLLNSNRYNPVLLQFYASENTFIDNQFLFITSRDNELEHSTLIDRQSNEVLDSSLVVSQIEKNSSLLELSKNLISQNKIKKPSVED